MSFLKTDGIYIIEDVEFVEYVASNLSTFVQQLYTGPRVGCGVSDNNLIVMRPKW